MRCEEQVDRKNRLRWRCRRGLLELDVLLERFAAQKLDSLSANELDWFESLLAEPDHDLLALLEARQPPPKRLEPIVQMIRASV